MKEKFDKLIENILKDILLGNAALTFIFAINEKKNEFDFKFFR